MRLTLLAALATAPAVGCGPQHAPPPNLERQYMESSGTHSERPGKHSTTTGRHGTSGEIGGGIDEQSGSGATPSEHPIIEQREQEQQQQP